MIAAAWLIRTRPLAASNVAVTNAIAAHLRAKTAKFRCVPLVQKVALNADRVAVAIA